MFDIMPVRMVKSEREFAFVNYACTYLADVDCGFLRGETKASPTGALSIGADAGTALSVQLGVRGLRQNPVSGACSQEESLA